jgi:Holliday junction resolvase RusA-like endonuclease
MEERNEKMNFFLAIDPPTATAQEKQVRVVHGKPLFYDPAPVKEAKDLLTAHLAGHSPDKPLTGALQLRTLWLFPKGRSHKNGEWRITKPDTDNLQKLLKDCMTRTRFWIDDAQVCDEHVMKFWGVRPGIALTIEELTP